MTLTLLLYSLILFSKREKDHAEYHTLMNYDCKESLRYTKQKQHVTVII